MIPISRFFLLAAAFAVLTFSCTKPVSLGSDFLEDEKSDLGFKDDFALSFHTEKTDSILTHSEDLSRQITRFLCGHIEDPVFGTYTAEIYAQPVIASVATHLIGATLDSVVLLMRYDTLGTYGQVNTPVTFEVFRMIEKPDYETEYYSNHRFLTSPELLGTATFIPNTKDSVEVIVGEDTTKTAPHARITLDKFKFGEFLTADSIVFENVDSFLHFFNGLYIRMSSADNSMLGFNLNNTLSGLTFYYDKDTLEDLSFKFIFTAGGVISTGTVKSVYMEHDYTGSLVGNTLGSEPEEEYWFIQGLSGATTSMRVEGLAALGNAVINSAELEVFCTFPNGDAPDLFPPCPYIVTQEKTDTSIVNSIDAQIALANSVFDHTSATYSFLYGGKLEDTIVGPPIVYRYNMKVTNQIKEIFNGSKENVIYFNPFSKGNVPNRAVFFGPNHPVYAPRLRIYYTAL